MDRAKAKAVGESVEKALASVLAEHGLTLGKRRGKFDEGGLTYTIELREKGAEYAREAGALRSCAWMYGLKPDVVGATIEYGARVHPITKATIPGSMMVVLGLRGNGSARLAIVARDVASGRVVYVDAKAIARGNPAYAAKSDEPTTARAEGGAK